MVPELMLLLAILAVLVIVASVAKALCDAQAHKSESFIWWGSKWFGNFAWWNKWKKSDKGDRTSIIEQKSAPWYYLWIYKPQYVEAFPYSSTALVFLTDGWHFFNWVQYTCYQLAITFALLRFIFPVEFFIVIFLTLKILQGIYFELFYRYVFVKKS